MAQILLVNPLTMSDDPVEAELVTPYFPLGILYVAAALRQVGHSVAVYDAMFAEGDDGFVQALQVGKPQIVGFGVLATEREAALRLAGIAHRQGALVVMGGADPTARPEAYLMYTDRGSFPVAVVVVGEAEETMVDLVPLLLQDQVCEEHLKRVAGLAYRDTSGGVARTLQRPLVQDVDALALPARDLVDYEPYRKAWRGKHGHFALSLIATRGCPFDCSWCQKAVFGRSFRPRSAALVAEEMRLLKETLQPDFMRIVDDVMGIDRRWVRQWRDAVVERDALIPFECLSRVDLMDREMAEWLKETGCYRIAFGAESGSQRVLDSMSKHTTVEQAYRAAEVCRKVGIECYYYMMVGYPGEEWTDLKLSVRMLREARPDQFSTTIAYPLPGTMFFDQLKEQMNVEDLHALDWSHTAENRLLFERERYSTRFYRYVIRWFHHEWEDAWQKAGRPTTVMERWKTRLALWRDRILVHLLAKWSGSRRAAFAVRPAIADRSP